MNRSDEGTELAELCAPRGRHGHRAGVVRGVAKRGLVAFLAFAMAFSTTPAQMWADGAEGIAQAVTQTAEGDGNGQGASSGQSAATSTDADNATAGTSASGDASATGETSAANAAEGSASNVASGQQSASAGNVSVDAAGTATQSQDGNGAVATQSSVTVDDVYIVNAKSQHLDYASNPAAKVGDVIHVEATYDDGWDEDEEITDSEYAQLQYQWYIGSKESAAFSASGYIPIKGATGRYLTITSDMEGRWVACRVTYGSNSWQYRDTNSIKKAIEGTSKPSEPEKTSDEKTLDAAVAKAKSVGYSGWYPDPSANDKNICDMLSSKLAEWGYLGITVSLSSVERSVDPDPNQVGGIAADGAITRFFLSPADKTSNSDYSVLRQFKPTYKLLLGSASVEYTPGRYSTLPWDETRVSSYLDAAFKQLDGLPETIESDVKSGTLPYEIRIGGKEVANIEWSSSDTSVAKLSGGSYEDYKVAYTHGMRDEKIILLATVTMAVPGYGNAPSTKVNIAGDVTVKAKSAEEIASEKKELEDALDKIEAKTTVFGDSSKGVDFSAVDQDFTLPRASKLIRGSVKLKYECVDNPSVKLNGYHAIVTRDLEGESNTATITATLTRNGISASREITVTVKPLVSLSEIDDAVAFMDKVKADYGKTLLGKNESVDSVTTDLSTFAEAVQKSDGSIEYHKGKDSTLTGIVASDLPGYDSMAGTNWRTYRSSDPNVIQDETLKVTRPERDTLVTVTSNLTYAKYESLAKAHPENAQLQKLVNQTVSATFRVVGTSDHSDPQISVNFELVGVGADGSDEIWSNGSQQVAYSSTADKLIESVLDELGLKHTSSYGQYGYYLSDVTSSDGRQLGYDQTTGKYWQLFVNGAASDASASGVKLAPGDSIALYYSTYGASLDDIGNAKVKSSISFIGPNAEGDNSVWYSASDVKLKSGSTAADLAIEGLKASGLSYTCFTPEVDHYFYLSDITSKDGRKLGYDQKTGKYWQLYVNGVYSQVGADQVVLNPDDKIQFIYAADDEKPLDSLIINPSASRPDWSASWNGFGNSGNTTLVNVPTPSESAELLWKADLKKQGERFISMGDPIIAGGFVFITTDTELIKIDATGKIVARTSKGGKTSYFSRPVYADGLIISANDDGSLCAFSAETLECVWKTPSLGAPSNGGSYQSNSTMTVSNGCVYAEFVTGVSYSGTASGGVMRCVDLSNGTVKWDKTTVKSGSSTGEGYYWAGACASGSDLVIADESGYVKLVDGATGDVKSSASIDGLPCRATVVSAGKLNGKETYLVVGRDPGTLFKVVREGDSLSIAGKCKFGGTSTSTPAVANGKVYIGGNDSSHNGRFTVIDLDTLKVEKSIDMGAGAEVKASPLVSVQGDDTFVYFTSNKQPGSLYRFSQKTGEVVEVYTPSGNDANYCTASVVADSDGNLYYTNDSGTLFALKASAGYRVSFDSAGGSTVPSAMPVQGKPMAQIADPVREGYKFLGWFTQDGAKWDFSKPVTGNMTLTAKWEKKPSKSDDSHKGDNSGSNGGNGGNGGTVDNDNVDNNGADNGTNSGSGTAGRQAGGSVAATHKAVSSKAEGKKTSGSKSSDDKKSDKDSKNSKNDKKKGDNSSKGSNSSVSSSKATRAAKGTELDSGFGVDAINPWAIAGIAVGVIGLALIVWFVFGRRKGEDDDR